MRLLQLSIVLLFVSCQRSSSDGVNDNSEFSELFSSASPAGTIESAEIDEASGLAVSRSNENYLWTHNDSGGDPVIYLLSEQGADVGRIELEGAINRDWEDLAIGPGPQEGINYLFVGDIGDNRAVRESLSIYRLAEPSLPVSELPINLTTSEFDRIEFEFPDGSRDSETLMIDPFTRDIIILSKREKNINVYRLNYPQSLDSVNEAEYLTSLPFTQVVAGDISENGLEILIKTYDNVYYWSREASQSITDTFKQEPEILPYSPEPQGEAIAWAPDGSAYFTLSEKADESTPVLYRYDRN